MAKSNKIKAVDINIESLKLYITLSTVAIAGILTFYSSISNAANKTLFVCSIILFLLCAVLSVVIVNHFISQAHSNDYNVRTLLSRGLNFTAIILFLGGIITGSMFVGQNINGHIFQIQNDIPNGTIVIENNKISIGETNNMKVIIIQDSLSNIKEININIEE